MVRHNAAVRSILVALLLTTAGCGDGAAGEAPPQVTGLITSVERGDGGTITAFEVETEEGDQYRILIDPGRDYGFDLEHLAVHRDQALPVLVRSQSRGDEAVAIEILDA
jgi:hypothetical protein